MLDLYLALALVAALSVLLFAAGLKFSRRRGRRPVNLAALGAVGLIVLYLRCLQDGPLLLRLLPFSAAIVLANPLPSLAAFLGGLTWGRVEGRARRKGLTVLPLLAVAAWLSWGFLFTAPPACGDRWAGEVCLQTSLSSCSAAAAATLLRARGLEAGEREMAALCLTRERGTTLWGLYRGLKLKTAGSAWRVKVFSGDLEGLRSLAAAGPLIIIVCLNERPGLDPRYRERWGWVPGVPHAVVLYGLDENDRPDIGDPGVGREFWSFQALVDLWTGVGLRLEAAHPE